MSCVYLMEEQLLDHPWVRGDSAREDQMDAEIVTRLQRFNARRKLRAAAIASVLSSSIFLRTKKLKSLLSSHDLSQDEIENLRVQFKKMWVNQYAKPYSSLQNHNLFDSNYAKGTYFGQSADVQMVIMPLYPNSRRCWKRWKCHH